MTFYKRKNRPQQFDIFVENLETHVQSKNNDMNLKELIECLVTVTDKFVRRLDNQKSNTSKLKNPGLLVASWKSIKYQNKVSAKFKKSEDENNLRKYKFFKNNSTHIKDAAKVTNFQNFVEKTKGTSITWKVVNKIL